MIKTTAFQVSCEFVPDKGVMIRRVVRTFDDGIDAHVETSSISPITSAKTGSYVIGDYECIISFRRVKKDHSNE